MRNFLVLTLLVSFLGLSAGRSNKSFVLDERWVCNIKLNCSDCLRLPQCSWCGLENKCFSKTIPGLEDYCKGDALHYVDYGMGFEDNAKCICPSDDKEEVKQNCRPPGDDDAPECSNRGKCECGRCVCDAMPDPENPSKTIMGEYCEYDNFSCDGPQCNEGPYNINQLDNEESTDI